MTLTDHERRLEEYSRYLKVPSFTDFPEVRPILEEGLKAPLPDGWSAVLNEYGQTMYFHEASGACRVDHPMDELFRSKCLEVIAVLQNIRREEELTRQRSGINGEAIRAGDAVDDQATKGDSDWSLLEEEFGPVQLAAQPGGPLPESRTEESTRGESVAADVEPFSAIKMAPKNEPKHNRPCPVGSGFPESATSRKLVERMNTTCNREELLEVQRQVETLRALNETIQKDLVETKQQVEALQGVPDEFLCPITGELMDDPVVTADGFTYERSAITKWLKRHNRSPCTNNVLDHKHLVPNLALKSQISHLRDRRL